MMLLSAGLAQAQSKGAARPLPRATRSTRRLITECGGHLSELLQDYPTNPIVPAAQLQLAYSFYFLGQFDEALDVLKKAESGSACPPSSNRRSMALAIESLRKVGEIPAADPKRNSTFEEASAKLTEYITTPTSIDLENVIFGGAIAEYQLRKFDDAVKDLELDLQKFPQSSTLAKSKHLLAVTLATQGSALLVTGSAAQTKAFALYKRATDSLREIIKKKEDVALINEANFHSERFFSTTQPTVRSERPELYAEACRFSGGRAEGGNHRPAAKQSSGIRHQESGRLARQ